MRFELMIPCGIPSFQDGAINHYANPPVVSIIISGAMLSIFLLLAGES